MIELSVDKLVTVLGASSSGADGVEFCGVTIDSRGDCDGQLFVAIRGDNFDGHDFVAAARDNGAVCALVETPVECEIAQVVVEDCRQAMGQLANYWRRFCDPCVLSMTGSNGKTTVKEMLYQIMAGEGVTLATRGNLNNDIGVPLTLFRLDADVEYAVVEMGANHAGEIARLAEIAEPDIVYVNNVAAAHLAGFGSLQGVVEAKGEIYAYCSPEQKALFNADEAATAYWRRSCAAEQQMTCALDRDADFNASWQATEQGLRLEIRHQDEVGRCDINVFGEHNARNALAAVSMACMSGVGLSRAMSSLAGFSGVKGRLQMSAGPAGSRIIDDSYNANPDSLEAGIRVLCGLQGTAWLALGDMGELGDAALAMHREAARTALDLGVEKFFGLGEMSCAASAVFAESGHCCESVDEMAEAILSTIHGRVNLLIKGSRTARMERLVERMAQAAEEDKADAV